MIQERIKITRTKRTVQGFIADEEQMLIFMYYIKARSTN